MFLKVIPMQDIYLECKGLVTMVFDSVMRLEDAYKNGTHSDKKLRLKQYKQYRNFIAGQLEGDQLTLTQKISIYTQLYNMCLQILSHEREYYIVYHVIYRKTTHYATRIVSIISTLEENIKERHELEEAIVLKKVALMNLTKLRHHYKLVIDGITYSVDSMKKEIEEMTKKLESIK